MSDVPVALVIEAALMRRGIIESTRTAVLEIHLWLLEWGHAQWLVWERP